MDVLLWTKEDGHASSRVQQRLLLLLGILMDIIMINW